MVSAVLVCASHENAHTLAYSIGFHCIFVEDILYEVFCVCVWVYLVRSMTCVVIQGNLNLITQALEAVGCKMEVIPDPSTVHFHLPGALSVLVHREYNDFIEELVSKFPHEKEGILKFYGTCWKVLSLFYLLVFVTFVLLLSYATFTTYTYVSDEQIDLGEGPPR